MSITDFIKDLANPKKLIFSVNHVTKNVLTSATIEGMGLKFCPDMSR